MTLEELYNKVMSDRDSMAEFVKASGTNKLSEFAESHGCIATESEIRNFFLEQCSGEISDDEAESVAGGAFDFGQWISNLFNSIFGGLTGNSVSNGTAGSTISSSSVVGGNGIVKANSNLDKHSVVGKGIAPASTGNLSKSSIYKKM